MSSGREANETRKLAAAQMAAQWFLCGSRHPGIAISCLVTFVMAYAQSDLKAAPTRLTSQVTADPPREQCRRLDASDPIPLGSVSLHRTFHDDFDEHPLSSGKWVPHYAGGAAWPEARYWGGDGSDFERKTAYNGEQQIYVDPRYGGRATARSFQNSRWSSVDYGKPHAACHESATFR